MRRDQPSQTGRLYFLVDFASKDSHLGERMAAALQNRTGLAVEIVAARFAQPTSLLRKLARATASLLFPLRLLPRLRRGDHVLCWQQNFGLALGMALRLLRPRSGPALHVMNVITTGARRRWPVRPLIAFALGYPELRTLFAGLPIERDALLLLRPDLGDGRIVMQDQISEIDPDLLGDGPPPTRDGAFLSAGRSNRRYDRLETVFSRRPDLRLTIVNDALRRDDFPRNISVAAGVYGRDYIALLRRAPALVLDVADPTVLSGLLVFLDALQTGTPLVVTRSPVFDGYAIEGENCLCFGDADELEAALDSLSDPAVQQRLSAAQRRDYRERFSVEAAAERVADALLRA